MDKKFMQAIKCLPMWIYNPLEKTPAAIQERVCEIQIRSNKPVVIMTHDELYFLDKQMGVTKSKSADKLITTPVDVQACLRALTEYSLHSCKEKINEGYITLKGGHRAGIVGSCVSSAKTVLSVSDISSINLRIAREIKDCALKLAQRLYQDGLTSALLVGAPSSGKTTMLRDISRLLASGECGRAVKLSLIDERGELAATKDGAAQNDVGLLCDVLDSYHKGEGMQIALRSMSPQMIVLDEIGSAEDAASIMQSINAGVHILATAHAATISELYSREHIRMLLDAGAFQHIVLLGNAAIPGTVREVVPINSIQKRSAS